MEGDFVAVRVWELVEEVGVWGRWEVEKRERGEWEVGKMVRRAFAAHVLAAPVKIERRKLEI